MLHLLADRLLARAFRLDVNTVVWLEADDVKTTPADAPAFEFRFLCAEEVEAFAHDPANGLGFEFVARARRGRDLCFAALQGTRLAAYGWYALHAIEPRHANDVGMALPRDVAYMYKGFTHPDFRGLRLHAAGMGGALLALGLRGVRRLVSTVHWTNHASLRSCDRLGYRRLGSLVTYRFAGHRHLRCPADARRRGIEFGDVAVVPAAAPALAPTP